MEKTARVAARTIPSASVAFLPNEGVLINLFVMLIKYIIIIAKKIYVSTIIKKMPKSVAFFIYFRLSTAPPLDVRFLYGILLIPNKKRTYANHYQKTKSDSRLYYQLHSGQRLLPLIPRDCR